jgi:hypothetical protein
MLILLHFTGGFSACFSFFAGPQRFLKPEREENEI